MIKIFGYSSPKITIKNLHFLKVQCIITDAFTSLHLHRMIKLEKIHVKKTHPTLKNSLKSRIKHQSFFFPFLFFQRDQSKNLASYKSDG